MHTPKHKRNLPQQGFSLVELMVAMVIGLIVSLAVYVALNSNEAQKRTTTSINDIDQAGAYAAYVLDKVIRNAGSGFTAGLNPTPINGKLQSAAMYTVGCRLRVTFGSSALIPKSGTFAAPFSSVPVGLRVAPIIIVNNGATRGDALISMAGSGGMSESVNLMTDHAPILNRFTLINSAGVSTDDRLLAVAATAGTEPIDNKSLSDCIVDQVASGAGVAGPSVNITLATGAGKYYVNPTLFPAITKTGLVFNLGKKPEFVMLGVGDNNTLFKYDLLAAASTTAGALNPSPLVDSVYALEAIYGVSATPGALVWTAPGPTGPFAAATLLNGSSISNENIRSIKAVRLAIVTRTSLLEKTAVSPGTLTLFADTGVPKSLDIPVGDDRRYRYKVLEATIPVRNSIALN